MKIETKYKPGDYVLVMHNNAPVHVPVDKVQTSTYWDGDTGPEYHETVVKYFLKIGQRPETDLHNEKVCFETKEELLASL